MSQSTLNIVPGPFASVSSGNCTQTWMLDGDDIQERANAALDPYWGATATVFCRGVEGYGLQIEGHADFLSVYKTMEDAERARVRALGA